MTCQPKEVQVVAGEVIAGGYQKPPKQVQGSVRVIKSAMEQSRCGEKTGYKSSSFL